MNYNPYAAPQGGQPPPPGSVPQAGTPQPWEIGEIFSRAWEAFKLNWGVLVGSLVVVFLINLVPGFVPSAFAKPVLAPSDYLDMPASYWVASGGSYVVITLLAAFFETGTARINLAAARGQTPSFADLFSGADRYLPMLGLKILLYIGLSLGIGCLVIPGILLYLGFWAAPYYVVNANLGTMDALRASWNATKGQWGALFLFFLLGVLLWMGGYVACCLGLLVTAPLFELSKAFVFLRISGRGAAVAPAAGGYGPPGGYGGPPGGPPPAGGYGPPPGGGYGPPPGGGYGGPPPGGAPPAGGGYGGPPPGGGGYGPPGGGGGGYGPPGGGGGGYGPGGGGGYGPGGGGGYGPGGGGPPR